MYVPNIDHGILERKGNGQLNASVMPLIARSFNLRSSTAN